VSNDNTAMALKLYDIFSCKTVRALEIKDNGLVNEFVCSIV